MMKESCFKIGQCYSREEMKEKLKRMGYLSEEMKEDCFEIRKKYSGEERKKQLLKKGYPLSEMDGYPYMPDRGDWGEHSVVGEPTADIYTQVEIRNIERDRAAANPDFEYIELLEFVWKTGEVLGGVLTQENYPTKEDLAEIYSVERKMISCFKGLAPLAMPTKWLEGFDYENSFAYERGEARIRFSSNEKAFGVRFYDNQSHVRILSEEEARRTNWGPICNPWESYETAKLFGHGESTKLDRII